MTALTIDRTKKWTVDEYLMLGEIKTPCQLINGEIIMSPAPSTKHQQVSRRLFKIIDAATSGKGELFYAPIDLYIDSVNVFQPDLLYLSEANRSSLTDRGVEGPVDIVVEISSPSNSNTDRHHKKINYLNHGVGEYWIVDPANGTIEIYTPQRGMNAPIVYRSESEIVESIHISMIRFELSELF